MPASDGSEKLVRVATAPNPTIAASWQEMLRQEGIPAMVKVDDPLGVAYQVLSPYACGIYVLASQREQARGLLDEMIGSDVEHDGSES